MSNYTIKQFHNFPIDSTCILAFINPETRSLGILSRPKSELGHIDTVHLIILHRELANHNLPGLDALINSVEDQTTAKSLDLHIHYLNFFNPEFSTELFRIFSKENIFTQRPLLDITTCPPAVMVPLFEVLIGHQQHTLNIAYSIPAAYNIDLIQEIEGEELESGDIKTYGTTSLDETNLIIIAGLENKKAHTIAEFVNPTEGYLLNNIFSKNVTESTLAKTTMKLHLDLINLENYRQFNLPRYDLHRILNTFSLLQNANPDKNLVISCFGSKIQRLAALFFVSQEEDRAFIDIVPADLSFNPISTGLKDILFYSISRND